MASEIEAAAELVLRWDGEFDGGTTRQAAQRLAKWALARLAADRAERDERARPIDAEITRLVGSAFVTVVSGDGSPRVQIAFETLEQAHAMHRALLGIPAKGGAE